MATATISARSGRIYTDRRVGAVVGVVVGRAARVAVSVHVARVLGSLGSLRALGLGSLGSLVRVSRVSSVTKAARVIEGRVVTGSRGGTVRGRGRGVSSV